MGRIVVTEFVSLDGVFESPGPSGDFEPDGVLVLTYTRAR